ncbi:MAG: DUF1232 domain-containing protein [Myxococcota bacterium]|jgi:uncharacterized membrane protein YkvA (DUF1232 family)
MNLLHVRRYLASPLVPRWRKLLGLLALVYVVVPVDAVPDMLPVVGWLDDVGVVAAVLAFFARDVKKHGAAPAVVDAR